MSTAVRQTSPRGPLQRALNSPALVPTPDHAPNFGVRQIKARSRAFITIMASSAALDPVEAARKAGYSKPTVGNRLAIKFADLIQAERVRLGGSTQMEIDECLRGTASLARAANDERVQLGAYRTLLQVHGALSEKPLPPAERRSVLATIEELVQSIAQKADASGGGKTRALAEYINKDKRRVRVGVEVSAPVSALPELLELDSGLEPPED